MTKSTENFYKIEFGIEAPRPRKQWVQIAKELKVGASVMVADLREAASLKKAVYNLYPEAGLLCRHSNQGVRVWRVS